MEITSWTEEDLKNKLIIPFFRNRDFDLFDMEFETPFKVTVGTKRITVRSDILVKIAGHPVIVVEIKKPRQKIAQADIDQAISYARLCDTIVPFVMVTNLEETRLYDTYTRSRVSSIPSYEQSLQTSQQWSIADEFKLEALRALYKLNYGFLLDFCRVQRKTRMMHLSNVKKGIGKFDPALYLPRNDIENRFEEFLKCDDQCFALIGDQGAGKTFTMITLAEKYGEKQPALFYDLAFLPNTLDKAIEEDFGWGRKQRPWVGDIFVQVDEILKKHNAQMIIFADAVNEPIPMRSRKIDIVNLVRRLGETSIRLCLACRTLDWEFFSMDKGDSGAIAWVTYVSPAEKTTSSYFGGHTVLGSCKLTNFSDVQLGLVFPKYRNAFQLKGGLTKETKELCKHPETLRIVSETYSHGTIPRSLRRRKILDEFWRKKVQSIGNRHMVEYFLLEIGHLVLENKTTEIGENDLIESINWNNNFQKIYRQALSENVLVNRRDRSGNNYIRISPNVLLDYVVAKLLVKKYPSKVRETIIANVDTIVEHLKSFVPLNGILLLYCSLQDNPPELVLYLLEKLDVEKVMDQVLDENPEVMDIILINNNFRSKIIHILLKENDFYKLVRTITSLLTRKRKQAKPLVMELTLSPEFQRDIIRLSRFMDFIVRNSKFDAVYFDLLNSLLDQLKEQKQRKFVDFLYRINSLNPKLSKKILAKFKIGELRHLITSTLDGKENGRSLYLLSKINSATVQRMEPSGRILHMFFEDLRAGTISRPDPLQVCVKQSVLRKIHLHESLLQMLLENPDGLAWRQMSTRLGQDKYKVLATLEILTKEEIVSRKTRQRNKYMYKLVRKKPFTEMPLKYNPYRLSFAKDRFLIKEFTERIIFSNFASTLEDFDDLIEEMMLGRYLRNWKTTFEFFWEILSCSMDITKQYNVDTLEIPGKTFHFLVKWFKKSEGFRKYLAGQIVQEMSKTAPKMFKNMILGVRVRPRAKGAPVEIKSSEEFEQRLTEFSIFFGKAGVKTPTKDAVFKECIRSLRKRTEFNELVTSEDTIEFIHRLRDIFREKSSEIEPFEKRMATVIKKPIIITQGKIMNKDASEILIGITNAIVDKMSSERLKSIEVWTNHLVLMTEVQDRLLIHYTGTPSGDALLNLHCWSANKSNADKIVSEIMEITKEFLN